MNETKYWKRQRLIRRINDFILVIAWFWTMYSIYSFIRVPNLVTLFFRLLVVPLRYFFGGVEESVEEKMPHWLTNNAVMASYLKNMLISNYHTFMGRFYLFLLFSFPRILARFFMLSIGFVIGSFRLIANGYLTLFYQTLFAHSARKEFDAETLQEITNKEELRKMISYEDIEAFEKIRQSTVFIQKDQVSTISDIEYKLAQIYDETNYGPKLKKSIEVKLTSKNM